MRFATSIGLAAATAVAALSGRAQALQCSFELGTIAIGRYSAIETMIERTEVIRVRCTVDAAPIPANGTALVNVALGAGHGGSYLPMRTLPGALPGLKYNFYLSPSYQQPWGDSGTDQLTFSVSGLTALNTSAVSERNVMLRVPAAQWGVAPGAYSDNLVVTLTF